MKLSMNKTCAIFLTFALSMIFSTVLFAESDKSTDIYKWTDADGRIHYAARPPNEASAQKMNLGSKTFHKVSSKQSGRQLQLEKERAKQCTAAEKSLRQYKKAPFLYRYDEEKQQKIRLSKQETKDTLLSAEKDVSYWCNPKTQ